MIIGASVFALILATFLGVFKKFTMVFASYQTISEMHKSTSQMSLEQRNKVYAEHTSANKKCKKAMKKQCKNQAEQARKQQAQQIQYTYAYLPPCSMPPSFSLTQRLVEPQPQPQQPAADLEAGAPRQAPVQIVPPQPQAVVEPAPRQATTYTLEQV